MLSETTTGAVMGIRSEAVTGFVIGIESRLRLLPKM
jgi:hypothetical protein